MNYMFSIYFISTLLFGNNLFITGQLLPNIPPEKVNTVNYTSVYSKESGKCIITKNTQPVPGMLLNKPYLGTCSGYKANFYYIQLPANTYPICSLDPNWVSSSLSGYYLASSYWYPIDADIFHSELHKCINKLNSLGPGSAVKTMYGLDAKNAFCKRHVEFNLKVFGNTLEIKNTKNKILKRLNNDFPNRVTNQMLSEFIITSTCIGTNLDGCVKMWERLLEEKDNSILNTLGYKFNKKPSTWLYADGLEIQLAHIWSNLNGLAIEKSEYNNILRYRVVYKSPNTKETFWSPGIIG